MNLGFMPVIKCLTKLHPCPLRVYHFCLNTQLRKNTMVRGRVTTIMLSSFKVMTCKKMLSEKKGSNSECECHGMHRKQAQ